MTPNEVTLRAYRSGDEGDLVALYPRVFGHAVSEEEWRWKLKACPCPAENVWLAEKDGRVVFQYAGMPARLSIDGRVLDALVSVDTMVEPSLQRSGLITSLAPRVYAAWRAAGVAFVYGTPNEKWGSMLEKLGFVPLFRLEWLTLPLRPEILLARRAGLTWPRGLSLLGAAAHAAARRPREEDIAVREVDTAGAEFDALWTRLAPRFSFSLVRDRTFVAWRFLGHPVRPYRLLLAERGGVPVGYAAFRIRDENDRVDATLAEVVAAPDDRIAGASLLRSVRARAYEAGAESLRALAVPGHFTHAWMRSAGLVARKSGWNVVLSPLDPMLPMDRLADIASWYYGGGDSDVI